MGGHRGAPGRAGWSSRPSSTRFGRRSAASWRACNLARCGERRSRPMRAEDRRYAGMGCTLVACVRHRRRGAYWIRWATPPLWCLRSDGDGGGMDRLNADHSMRPVLDELVRLGRMTSEEAGGGAAQQLRSALTGEDLTLVDDPAAPVRLGIGDRILLASDGAGDARAGGDLPLVRWAPDAQDHRLGSPAGGRGGEPTVAGQRHRRRLPALGGGRRPPPGRAAHGAHPARWPSAADAASTGRGGRRRRGTDRAMTRRARAVVGLVGSVLAAPVAAQPPAATGVVVVRAAGAEGSGRASAEAAGLGFVAGEAYVIAVVGAGESDFVVSGAGGAELDARLVASYNTWGLGLLAVPGLTAPPYRFARAPARAGQEVYGATREETSGGGDVGARPRAVRAARRRGDRSRRHRHDAFDDRQRNLGAPLLNICGEVVGAVIDDANPAAFGSRAGRARRVVAGPLRRRGPDRDRRRDPVSDGRGTRRGGGGGGDGSGPARRRGGGGGDGSGPARRRGGSGRRRRRRNGLRRRRRRPTRPSRRRRRRRRRPTRRRPRRGGRPNGKRPTGLATRAGSPSPAASSQWPHCSSGSSAGARSPMRGRSRTRPRPWPKRRRRI